LTGQSIGVVASDPPPGQEDEIRAAAVQLNSTADKARNLETAQRLTREAAADGAELVVLPEKWTLLGDSDTLLAGAEALEGESVGAAREWARELGIHLVAGSIAERVGEGEKTFNTSVAIAPDGEVVATYRKIHMFDVDVGGTAYRESDAERPGEDIVVADAGEAKLGLTICYDLRFPELYRILAVLGATVITGPSAFTEVTGRDHWHVLLRARAIENQAFVVAANQVGNALPHYSSYGHSLIAGPWGDVLAERAEGEGFAAADLNFAELERIRAELPSLAHRRPEAYRWPRLVEATA
jgi:predicted amidohydrolase